MVTLINNEINSLQELIINCCLALKAVFTRLLISKLISYTEIEIERVQAGLWHSEFEPIRDGIEHAKGRY